MRRIDRVIYKEIAAPAVIALFILTFVVFTREFGRLTEILIRKNADVFTVLKVVLSILPSILIFTVPIAFLVGTLIGFARLSTESEIVAMRAGGIGLYQILFPVLKVSVLVAALTFCLTMFLLPAGNWSLKLVRHNIGLRPVQSQIKPRVFNEDLPGKLLYVEDIDLNNRNWEGVFLSDNDPGGQQRIVLARDGQLLFSEDAKRLQIFFGNGSSYEFNRTDPTKYLVTHFGTLDVTAILPETESASEKPKRPGEMTPTELLAGLDDPDPVARHESVIELNRRLALPLSALVFAVLGVTFGITSHRGGRGYGSIMSMVVAFTYYILFATGSKMASQGAVSVWAGVWGANILLGLIALVSIRLTRRGAGVITFVGHYSVPGVLMRRGSRLLKRSTDFLGTFFSRLGNLFWQISSLRLRIARVIDIYMTNAFLLNLALTILTCISLFYLFTFFELLDDMVANNANYSILFQYFFHLLPHVLMLLVPISVLIATLVTFGNLERTAQIVAFKSCGISVFRLALPVISVAAIICIGTFVLQDYVLPYANQRQDNLRMIIKGRPVQTFYQPGHNWIFGQDNRLYNYNYFDPKRSLFGDLSIYELNIRENLLVSHTYAKRAQWDGVTGQWKLGNGWTRDLQKDSGAFETFEGLDIMLPEDPGYFVQEVTEFSKMTYLELDDYIQELQQGGFEVDHLKTELYKKASFPLVSLVMVILGIPFAFSVGRKGALYGIAAGCMLGIVYWGAFGVFGVLGGNGLLSPALAAWGPNLIFGSGSFVMFLGVKT